MLTLLEVFFRVPETKDLDYDQLTALFEANTPARRFASYKDQPPKPRSFAS